MHGCFVSPTLNRVGPENKLSQVILISLFLSQKNNMTDPFDLYWHSLIWNRFRDNKSQIQIRCEMRGICARMCSNDRWMYWRRFLTDENSLEIPDHFLPYGAGTRRCPGESLAEIMLFLFFSTIMHQLTVKSANKNFCLEGEYDFIIRPHPFALVFEEREGWVLTPQSTGPLWYTSVKSSWDSLPSQTGD